MEYRSTWEQLQWNTHMRIHVSSLANVTLFLIYFVILRHNLLTERRLKIFMTWMRQQRCGLYTWSGHQKTPMSQVGSPASCTHCQSSVEPGTTSLLWMMEICKCAELHALFVKVFHAIKTCMTYATSSWQNHTWFIQETHMRP